MLRAGPSLADHVVPLGVLPRGGGSLDLGLVIGGGVGVVVVVVVLVVVLLVIVVLVIVALALEDSQTKIPNLV